MVRKGKRNFNQGQSPRSNSGNRNTFGNQRGKKEVTSDMLASLQEPRKVRLNSQHGVHGVQQVQSIGSMTSPDMVSDAHQFQSYEDGDCPYTECQGLSHEMLHDCCYGQCYLDPDCTNTQYRPNCPDWGTDSTATSFKWDGGFGWRGSMVGCDGSAGYVRPGQCVPWWLFASSYSTGQSHCCPPTGNVTPGTGQGGGCSPHCGCTAEEACCGTPGGGSDFCTGWWQCGTGYYCDRYDTDYGMGNMPGCYECTNYYCCTVNDDIMADLTNTEVGTCECLLANDWYSIGYETIAGPHGSCPVGYHFNDCPGGQSMDAWGECAPTSWIDDGYPDCHGKLYGYDLCNYGDEHGDCPCTRGDGLDCCGNDPPGLAQGISYAAGRTGNQSLNEGGAGLSAYATDCFCQNGCLCCDDNCQCPECMNNFGPECTPDMDNDCGACCWVDPKGQTSCGTYTSFTCETRGGSFICKGRGCGCMDCEKRSARDGNDAGLPCAVLGQVPTQGDGTGYCQTTNDQTTCGCDQGDPCANWTCPDKCGTYSTDGAIKSYSAGTPISNFQSNTCICDYETITPCSNGCIEGSNSCFTYEGDVQEMDWYYSSGWKNCEEICAQQKGHNWSSCDGDIMVAVGDHWHKGEPGNDPEGDYAESGNRTYHCGYWCPEGHLCWDGFAHETQWRQVVATATGDVYPRACPVKITRSHPVRNQWCSVADKNNFTGFLGHGMWGEHDSIGQCSSGNTCPAADVGEIIKISSNVWMPSCHHYGNSTVWTMGSVTDAGSMKTGNTKGCCCMPRPVSGGDCSFEGISYFCPCLDGTYQDDLDAAAPNWGRGICCEDPTESPGGFTCEGGGGGDDTCTQCYYDFTPYGSECCDSAWYEYNLSCAQLEANYNWDCTGCNCPGG